MKKISVKDMLIVALFVAVCTVFAQMTFYIPFVPLPITMSFFGVFFSSTVLGAKRAVLTQVIYLLLGVFGLPVFASFKGGIGVFNTPSGGYLLSYLIIAAIVGWYADKCKKPSFITLFPVMIVTLSLVYLFCAAYISFVVNCTFVEAIMIGVMPYIYLDIVKCIMATIIAITVRDRLLKSKLI